MGARATSVGALAPGIGNPESGEGLNRMKSEYCNGCRSSLSHLSGWVRKACGPAGRLALETHT